MQSIFSFIIITYLLKSLPCARRLRLFCGRRRDGSRVNRRRCLFRGLCGLLLLCRQSSLLLFQERLLGTLFQFHLLYGQHGFIVRVREKGGIVRTHIGRLGGGSHVSDRAVRVCHLRTNRPAGRCLQWASVLRRLLP